MPMKAKETGPAPQLAALQRGASELDSEVEALLKPQEDKR
jgi:hypothetical protein